MNTPPSFKSWAPCAALLFLTAAPTLGQLDQMINRGGTGAIYDASDVDSVNLFNGGLSITIPIGPRFPVNTFSYGFQLTYSSSLWDVEDFPGGEVIPSVRNNAGMGWAISMGELYQPGIFPPQDPERWIYVDPSGGSHAFYQRLHNDANPGSGEDDDVEYTRDGTYLRMKLVNSSTRTVELPDGQIHTFLKNGAWEWRLDKIEDRYGNWVKVTYSGNDWRVSDSIGRLHEVNFAQGAPDTGDRLQEVKLEAFGSTAWSTYGFQYAAQQTMDRCGPTGEGGPDEVTVDFLKQINLPSGERWKMQSDGGTLWYYLPCDQGGGRIKQIRTPHRGQVQWVWGDWILPTDPDNPLTGPILGVVERKKIPATGSTIGHWKYRNLINPNNSLQTQTYVKYPNDADEGEGCAKHQFAADPDHWSYGLPLNWDENISGAGGQLYRSVDLYKKATTATNFVCSGGSTHYRSVYVRYDHDDIPSGAEGAELRNLNRRLEAQRTIYRDDGSRYTQVQNKRFDGLGHYRESVYSGNLNSAHSGHTDHSRTTFTNFNRTTQDYPSGNYTDPSVGTAWVLGIHTYTQVTEDGETAREDRTFDNAKGGLTYRRIRSQSSGTHSHDVEVTYTLNGDGNATEEAWSTGSGADYTLIHAYSGGRRKSTRIQGTNPQIYLLNTTIDVDTGLVATSQDVAGLATTYEYDNAGRLQRTIPTGGHNGACVDPAYTNANGSQEAVVHTKWLKSSTGSNGCSGTILAETKTELGPFGRVVREGIRQPSGWVWRSTKYNSRGWMTETNTWDELGSTRYKNFDPFGRPGKIIPPDGTDTFHETTMTYTGVRYVKRVGEAQLSVGGGEATITLAEQFFDSHGRLVTVRQSAKPSGGAVDADYYYDVGSRIRAVLFGSGAAQQRRDYTYDNRGLLTSMKLPEIGGAGNGTRTFSGYDAWGNVGRVDDGNNDLYFDYDNAGRLERVEESLGGGNFRDLKEFDWDGAAGVGRLREAIRHNYVDLPNDGSGLRDVEVSELYEYENSTGGTIKRRFTTIDMSAQVEYAFDQYFTHDGLGNLKTVDYPDCHVNGIACPTYGEPDRTVSYNYSRGYLTSVPDYLDSITYHGNGLWEQMEHVDSAGDITTVDVLEKDDYGIPRPKEIRTHLSGGGNLYTTDDYSYDGQGYVKKRGDNNFAYDRVGRLVYAEEGCDNPGTCHKSSYGYDDKGYGNLESVTYTDPSGSSTTRSWTVQATTNRLFAANYDASGNMTTSPHHEPMAYDAANMIAVEGNSASPSRVNLYTAGDQRIWEVTDNHVHMQVFLRDLDNNVIRVYQKIQPLIWEDPYLQDWAWAEDYVYRGGALLAKEMPGETTWHFHLDHLGTPRMVSDESGTVIAHQAYLPFGEYFPPGLSGGAGNDPFRFTGHEARFSQTPSGSADDLDYMHARYYSHHIGRFTSVDPLDGDPARPQSLNRYAYVRNSPINFLDPAGLETFCYDLRDTPDGQEITCVELIEIITITIIERIPPQDLEERFDDFDFEAISRVTLNPCDVSGFQGVDLLASPTGLLAGTAATAPQLGPIEFYNAVKPGGPWDLKARIRTGQEEVLENFGNFHFGVAASARGIPLTISTLGAGVVQSHRQPRWFFSSLGDDPIDAAFVSLGYASQQAGCF